MTETKLPRGTVIELHQEVTVDIPRKTFLEHATDEELKAELEFRGYKIEDGR